MCRLAGVSRRGFYRPLKEREPADEEMEARSGIEHEPFPIPARRGVNRAAVIGSIPGMSGHKTLNLRQVHESVSCWKVSVIQLGR